VNDIVNPYQSPNYCELPKPWVKEFLVHLLCITIFFLTLGIWGGMCWYLLLWATVASTFLHHCVNMFWLAFVMITNLVAMTVVGHINLCILKYFEMEKKHE